MARVRRTIDLFSILLRVLVHLQLCKYRVARFSILHLFIRFLCTNFCGSRRFAFFVSLVETL